MKALARRIGRLETSEHALALIKLANVGLTMIWGFAVTYVFVRTLPLPEFRAFLLLVAFGNFTISAEFGVTAIIYTRLRRFWLGGDAAELADHDFRLEEIGYLLFLMIGLVVVGALVLAGVMGAGIIHTGLPLLFMLYFVFSCLNAVQLLVKRGLSATDHNLFWEIMDLARRVLSLALLAAVLVGFSLLASVASQLLLSVLVILVGCARIHVRLGMRKRQWLSLRTGGRHVWSRYWRDIRSTVALTLSEMLAYNAPYFTIALATHDPRPMLLFDFVFKIARALSLIVRATVEAALPALTAAYFGRETARFRRLLLRALAVAVASAACTGLALLVVGPLVVHEVYDGKIEVGLAEMALLGLLILVLAITCVSVYLQGSLGRFSNLLRQSLPFLAGSLASVPVAALAHEALDVPFARMFLIFYTLVFVGTALLHAGSLRRLMKPEGPAA